MKTIYVSVPLIATLCFAGYHNHWVETNPACLKYNPMDRIRLFYEGRDGRQEALADIQSGKLRYFYSGCLRSPTEIEFFKLCDERFGIQIQHTSHFHVEEVEVYQREYNTVIWQHLEQRYGVSVETLRDEAHEIYWAKHRPALIDWSP
jgi:hypothetical protein